MNVQWRKSSHSGGIDDKQCVEFGRLGWGSGIGVRDSKDPSRGHLSLSVSGFAALLDGIKQHSSR